MKRSVSVMLLSTLLFALIAAVFDISYSRARSRRDRHFNVSANRINSEIAKAVSEGGKDPGSVVSERMEEWKLTFGRYCPENIEYIPISGNSDGTFLSTPEKNTIVCVMKDGSGNVSGLMRYMYTENNDGYVYVFVNAAILLSFLITVSVLAYVYLNIIRPFRKLSEYPERLARLGNIQKLPESRSRYFGRYVWGMNMLSDTLESSSRRIHSLEAERQTLLASIAHGVKTPVANIRLYAEAVRTGLYEESREKDIAGKIESNALKIEKLAKELLETSSSSLKDISPDISTFYLNELAELIRGEYQDRMKIKRIPFSVEAEGERIVENDKYALYRAVSQLLENAVKYGDGSGITVSLMCQDDSFSISVKNRGELLPENEMPYVFRSYWRGSNAAENDGSGIGLYVVHETVRALGGTVYARRHEDTSEMEFVLYFGK